jgi:hypothetical protein
MNTILKEKLSSNKDFISDKKHNIDLIQQKYDLQKKHIEELKQNNEGKVKEITDNEQIGTKKISKIEGDKISFEGADFTKMIDDILMKVEVVAGDESKKTADTLSKIKGDEEKMKQVNTYAEFIQKPENKDKIEQVNKILSGE